MRSRRRVDFSYLVRKLVRRRRRQDTKPALNILTLPAEIRHSIIQTFFVGSVIHAKRSPGEEKSSWRLTTWSSPLLFTCRQLFEEALPILYATALWDIEYSAWLYRGQIDASDVDRTLFVDQYPFLPDERLSKAMPFIRYAGLHCTSVLHLNLFPRLEILKPSVTIKLMTHEKQLDGLTDEEAYNQICRDIHWTHLRNEFLAKYNKRAISKLAFWIYCATEVDSCIKSKVLSQA